MIKVMTESGWVCVVIVLDWYTKKMVGCYASYQAKSGHWFWDLDMAVNGQFPEGVRGHALRLMLPI